MMKLLASLPAAVAPAGHMVVAGPEGRIGVDAL